MTLITIGSRKVRITPPPFDSGLDVRGFFEDAKLTPRQIECLLLASDGLTMREIAKLLGVSQPVVFEHIRSARRKLIRQHSFRAVEADPGKYVQAVLDNLPAGSPSIPLPSRLEIPTAQAYIKRSISIDERGCWVWRRARNVTGYGIVSIKYSKALAHRVAYHVFVQPIPSGLVIDHLCRNRACCNPEHLEAVTLSENSTRVFHAQRWKGASSAGGLPCETHPAGSLCDQRHSVE